MEQVAKLLLKNEPWKDIQEGEAVKINATHGNEVFYIQVRESESGGLEARYFGQGATGEIIKVEE